MNKSFSR